MLQVTKAELCVNWRKSMVPAVIPPPPLQHVTLAAGTPGALKGGSGKAKTPAGSPHFVSGGEQEGKLKDEYKDRKSVV